MLIPYLWILVWVLVSTELFIKLHRYLFKPLRATQWLVASLYQNLFIGAVLMIDLGLSGPTSLLIVPHIVFAFFAFWLHGEFDSVEHKLKPYLRK